jgi:YfiH family protein
MISLSALNNFPGIRHGFFTRNGGVSNGLYGSLNCGYGSGDKPENVTENRRLALATLDQEKAALVTAHQQHTNQVVAVDDAWSPDQAPVADGLVTNKPSLVLGILTADCTPVLLADAEAGIIGAAHAGWKGAFSGIIEMTVEKMTEMGARPENIVAAIGPAIAQRSYQVGPEFKQRFVEESAGNNVLFKTSAKDGGLLFDLSGYVWSKLTGTGVETIVHAPSDTCLEEDRFFSYRRSCLRGEEDYGRQLSIIVLENGAN